MMMPKESFYFVLGAGDCIRASHMLGESSASELHSRSCVLKVLFIICYPTPSVCVCVCARAPWTGVLSPQWGVGSDNSSLELSLYWHVEKRSLLFLLPRVLQVCIWLLAWVLGIKFKLSGLRGWRFYARRQFPKPTLKITIFNLTFLCTVIRLELCRSILKRNSVIYQATMTFNILGHTNLDNQVQYIQLDINPLLT